MHESGRILAPLKINDTVERCYNWFVTANDYIVASKPNHVLSPHLKRFRESMVFIQPDSERMPSLHEPVFLLDECKFERKFECPFNWEFRNKELWKVGIYKLQPYLSSSICDFRFSTFLNRSEQLSNFHECTAIFNMMGRIRHGAIASYITFIRCVEAAFSPTFAVTRSPPDIAHQIRLYLNERPNILSNITFCLS